jgi:hypothetical protein
MFCGRFYLGVPTFRCSMLFLVPVVPVTHFFNSLCGALRFVEGDENGTRCVGV